MSYSPALERFLEQDPNPDGQFSDGANLYLFEQANPQIHLDPFGLSAVTPSSPDAPLPEGTARVFFWKPSLKNFAIGHASMMVQPKSGSPFYVSWWPGAERKIKAPHIKDRQFPEDVRSEGRLPDRTFDVTGLDLEKIRSWWEKLNASDASWYLFHQQCAQTTIDGLRAGGYQVKHLSLLWSPWDVSNTLRYDSMPEQVPPPGFGVLQD